MQTTLNRCGCEFKSHLGYLTPTLAHGNIKSMKKCPRCEVVSDNFGKNASKSDGLQVNCKVCVKEINADYYKRSPEQNVNRLAYREKTKKECRTYILEYLWNHPCVDCGQSDVAVLEFDHIRDKKYNIATFTGGGRSVETLKEEIEKCEVRCANCHRKVTAQRGGWWRTL